MSEIVLFRLMSNLIYFLFFFCGGKRDCWNRRDDFLVILERSIDLI
jgi:hypothetical protein